MILDQAGCEEASQFVQPWCDENTFDVFSEGENPFEVEDLASVFLLPGPDQQSAM